MTIGQYLLLAVAVWVVVGFVGYRFMIKPRLAAAKNPE